MADFYEILGVAAGCSFDELKRAYYRQAKLCHPDHHGGHPAQAEAFKQLVEAFNTLSDPLARARYDQRRRTTPANRASGPALDEWLYAASILDTPADDILEELIVGNTLPRNTTLQTLMLDIERTDRFCLFREAKTRFYSGHITQAERLFDAYLRVAPRNILAHYYRGRCLRSAGRYRDAARAYVEAIRIGSRRHPPLQLPRIRRELHDLKRASLGWWTRLQIAWLKIPPPEDHLTPDERMRRDVSRAMRHLEQERIAAQRPQLPSR